MKEQQSLLQLLRRLWLHINLQRRRQFGALFFLMTATSLAEVISIGAVLPFLGVLTAPEGVFEHQLMRPLIQLFNLSEPKELLLPLTIVFAFAALLSGAMRLVLLWVQTRLSHAIGADFSISIYRRTLYQPYAVHLARNSSEVISGIQSKANSLVHYVVLPVLTIVSSTMMLLAIMGALIVIEPTVAFVSFTGFGIIYVAVIYASKKRLAQDGQRISREQNQVFKALQEGLGGIRDVLIDGTQSVYCKIYRDADLPLRRAQANVQIIGVSPRFGIEALGIVLIAVLAYSLAGRPDGVASAIPILGALALGAQRLLPVLQQSYSSWVAMRGGQSSLSDALDLLDQPLPDYVETSSAPISFRREIVLDNLVFSYTTQGPPVLQGLGLNIPKGSRIGFIGSTGSGKSTLLDIIMGLLQPTEGSLAIDNVVITPQNHRAWQKHIAHVPQTIFLADTTIAENIAFGIPLEKIDYCRIQQAAQQAQIAKTIESWSGQYNTLVGERGVRLSGGQRQRIGIARALYKQVDVIVLDEATSALDNDTEQAVMQAIEGLNDKMTILMVAHRLTTLKNCTQIVELGDGVVKRIGTYADIIGQST
jgi:ABC-type bacteriocin/lantibiotic exporter with double-glycine peptidase domain